MATKPTDKRVYVIRYKVANRTPEDHPMWASSLEQAEEAGRAYCQTQSDGFTPWRFISAKAILDADAILKIQPEVVPEEKPAIIEKPDKQEQLARLASRNRDDRMPLNPLSIA